MALRLTGNLSRVSFAEQQLGQAPVTPKYQTRSVHRLMPQTRFDLKSYKGSVTV